MRVSRAVTTGITRARHTKKSIAELDPYETENIASASTVLFSLSLNPAKLIITKRPRTAQSIREIIWRKKEAFSDGVSSKDRSWYQIIDELVKTQKTVKYDSDAIYDHNSPQTIEQLYYRTIFDEEYKGMDKLIPYFWMPKYIEANDSSARSLDIYNNNDKDIELPDNYFDDSLDTD